MASQGGEANGASPDGGNSNVPSNEKSFQSLAPSETSLTRTANYWNIYCLGVIMAIDGLFVQWNQGLCHGVMIYCVGLAVIIIGFIILSHCAAELTSALPFSGK